MRKFSILSVAIATLLSLSSCLDNVSYSWDAVGICGFWLEDQSDDPNSFYSSVTNDCVWYLNNYGYYAYASSSDDPDSGEQQIQMADYIKYGATVVIFTPINKSGYSEALQEIKNDEGYSICVNSELDDMTNVDAFVGTDNVGAGELIAEHLLDLRPEGGEVILIKGVSTADDDRAEGFAAKIAENSAFTIKEYSASGVRYADGQTAMSSAISAGESFANVVAIFGTSDELALGADFTAREQGKSGYELYGVDGTDKAAYAIVDRTMTATVAHDLSSIVSRATYIAREIISETTYDNYVKIPGTLMQRSDYIND